MVQGSLSYCSWNVSCVWNYSKINNERRMLDKGNLLPSLETPSLVTHLHFLSACTPIFVSLPSSPTEPWLHVEWRPVWSPDSFATGVDLGLSSGLRLRGEVFAFLMPLFLPKRWNWGGQRSPHLVMMGQHTRRWKPVLSVWQSRATNRKKSGSPMTPLNCCPGSGLPTLVLVVMGEMKPLFV